MKTTPTTKDAFDLFLKGSLALSRIEHNGVRVDVAYLEEAIAKLTNQIASLEDEMRKDRFYAVWEKEYGSKLKLGSYEQVGRILFGKMGYESKEKTATGRDKASKDVLEKIEEPFVKKFLKCQNLKKSLSTYLLGIKREIVGEFVHPSYNLNIPVSGRSGCSDPNWQNVPSRDAAMAEMIRRCYVPRKGRRIVEIDLVGAEVRSAACYNRDPVLIEYIKNPTTDMHRDTAMQLYFLEESQVEKKTSRDWSKNRFVFPQFYGSVYFQCAPDLWEPVAAGAKLPDGTTFLEHLRSKGIKKLGKCEAGVEPSRGTFEYHVREIERDFWDRRFKVYKQWKYDWYDAYCRNGEFTSLSGFRCGGIMKRNDVTNYPVQGFAFHWMLWVIVKMQEWLDRYRMKSKLIGEIHDSLVGDVVGSELQDYVNKVVELISVGLPKKWPSICVPTEAEVEVTPVDGSWFEKKQWVLNESGVWGPKDVARPASEKPLVFDRPENVNAARQAGIDAAGKNADPAWKSIARKVLRDVASSGKSFTADHVWAKLDSLDVEIPHTPSALGPLFLESAKNGEISKTGRLRRSRFVRRHRDLVEWVGTNNREERMK